MTPARAARAPCLRPDRPLKLPGAVTLIRGGVGQVALPRRTCTGRGSALPRAHAGGGASPPRPLPHAHQPREYIHNGQ